MGDEARELALLDVRTAVCKAVELGVDPEDLLEYVDQWASEATSPTDEEG